MTSDNQRAAAPSALDDVRVEVNAQLADQQPVAFPDIPEGGPEANWPGDDWVAFLDVAVRLDCKVIYTNTETLDKEEVDAVEEAIDAALTRLETLADPEDDLDERRALLRRLQSLIADIKVHNGDVGRIELAFADHGVVHRWERKTAWWDDFHSADVDNLLDEVENPLATVTGWRDRREEQQTELSRLEPRIAELIAEVLAVPGFLAGGSQRARRVAAQDAVDELGEWCRLGHDEEDPVKWAQRRAASQVFREAEDRLSAVRDERIAVARANEKALVDQIRADPTFSVLTTRDERRRHIRRYLEQEVGFPSAELTDRLMVLIRKPDGQVESTLSFD